MAIDASITGTPLGAITGSVTNADDGTINGTIGFVATGTISSTMGVPGPQGPTGPQGPIGPEGPPGEGGTWGSIVGDIEDQVDLWTELGSKYPASNPSGFITASALSPYLTTSTADATFQTLAGMSSYLTTSAAAAGYYPLTGNPSGFLTAASLSGYATESWVTGQGYITSSALTGYATESWVTSQGYLTDAPSDGNQYARKDGAWDIVSGGAGYITSVSSPLTVTSGDLSIDLSAYETTANATATYQTISGMSSYLTTSAAASTYFTIASAASKANLSGATFTGLVGTVASTTTTAGFRIPHGTAPTAPVNGDIWTTTSGLLARINGSTVQMPSLNGSNTFGGGTNTFSGTSLTFGNSTAASTINIGTGATLSGSTKTINIGTSGVAGSTTNITIGSTTGTSTTTLQGNTNGVTQSAGNSTTLLATTAFVTTADNLKANLASPTFTGTPAAPTAAADTNTTQLATTAYVVGQAGSATPLVNGTAAVGTSLRYARQDHVHGTDTSRAALASPTFTGTPAAPTAAVDTNTTQIATTAYVVGQGYLKSATASSTYAPLASPALTGTPTAPTATAGTNTTQIATTAFVTAAVPAIASTAQALSPSSTSVVLSPDAGREMIMYPGYVQMYGGGNLGTSGAGASSNITFASQRWHALAGPNAAVAGYAAFSFDYSFSGIGMAAMTRGVSALSRKWNSKIWASGRTILGQFAESTSGWNGDANTTARVMVGGRSSVGTGGMVAGESGMGWKVSGGGSAALVLTVSDGTTLTEVTSSFTPTLQQVFDWKLYSDGAGTVTLWVNDSQVATTTGGPSSSSTETYNLYLEIVDQTATTATRFAMANFGTKVFWSQP